MMWIVVASNLMGVMECEGRILQAERSELIEVQQANKRGKVFLE